MGTSTNPSQPTPDDIEQAIWHEVMAGNLEIVGMSPNHQPLLSLTEKGRFMLKFIDPSEGPL